MTDRQKLSNKKDWDEFWVKKRKVADVYPTSERIISSLKAVETLRDKKILEVGAGTGRDSFRLLEHGAEVYVLDYSRSAVEIITELNQNSPKKVQIILGDAFQIPVADESFDIVFHQGLLEHFREPAPLLKENVRILKPGGILLVDVPQRYHIYTIVKHILILFNKWFAGWETEFTIGQLERLIENAGVSVVYRYGNWMRPSFFYRLIREILLQFKIKLPLYPSTFAVVGRFREFMRQRLCQTKWAFYTGLDIGLIGRKIKK